jgi:hypothetical protein
LDGSLRTLYIHGMDGNRWVRIGSAPNESLAMMVEGLLRGADIPVLIQRSRGFDVPEFLAAGPREILVPEWAEPEAREIVEDTVGPESLA